MKLKNKIDIKKIKKDLKKLFEKTTLFAKRGEEELSKIARAGRVEIDILNLNIKKNQLYFQLGKKAHQLNAQGRLSSKNLKKLCDDINQIDKVLNNKKRTLKKYFKKKNK